MAQASAPVVDQDQFCSICLDLLNDPVSIPCGHSYCSACIEGFWSQDDQRGLFSCPQCTVTFNPRPVLKKDTVYPSLADMMDTPNITGPQDVPPDHCYAGPGDVACDSCTGRKCKAVKTCLQCLVSYCDTHLQPHYQSPAFMKHKLVKVSSRLQENICSCHGEEVRKLFCRTDQQCICYMCSVEGHKGHDIVPAAAERTKRQKEIDTSQKHIKHRILEKEKDVTALHQEVESINHCADSAVTNIDSIFQEMVSSIERRHSALRELIQDQQKFAVSRAEELRKLVEQEVTELRTRHAELDQISNTEDHIHFLHSYLSLPRLSESTVPPVSSSNVRPLRYFEDATLAVSKTRDKLEDMLNEEGTKVSERVDRVDVLLSTHPEHKTRAEFLQHSCPITMDPNTAHQQLSLSKGNRKVTWTDKQQLYRHHQERFTTQYQVLSTEALTGRCYVEVERSGDNVDIAIADDDISKTGDYKESAFGSNDKSWSLFCQSGSYFFRHRDVVTKLPGAYNNFRILGRVSSRVGLYLDHSAGTLSFYRVSSTMTLLHRVHTTFTSPLRVGVWVQGAGNSAELCDL